jgi:hypothetical protein
VMRGRFDAEVHRAPIVFLFETYSFGVKRERSLPSRS